MERCAVFVDAGYLFAQGSAVLAGQKQKRTLISLDANKVVAELKSVAALKSENKLLRIYWYDGAESGVRPTTDQATLAILDDVKLRLGFINSHGQQKGVDSLIVTDMIELARLKSISDAVLLSGDEDVRVGVQIAQNHGVRVHLLGIKPSRGSQSLQLMQEADTTMEWDEDVINGFLSLRVDDDRSADVRGGTPPVTVISSENFQVSGDSLETIRKAIVDFVSDIIDADLAGIREFWHSGERGVPKEFDSKGLLLCGQSLGRRLDKKEVDYMRKTFHEEVMKRDTK